MNYLVAKMRHMEFLNRETGVEPEIAEGSGVSGVIDCQAKVTIGENVFSGHEIMILTGGHDPNLIGQNRREKVTKKPINIEEGVWLGSRCIILGGVTIGAHSVIGAGAVVTKDVPPFQVWGGVPAKFIRNIPG